MKIVFFRKIKYQYMVIYDKYIYKKDIIIFRDKYIREVMANG